MYEDSRFDYHKWLRQEKWLAMAEHCKADAGYKCQQCKDPSHLVAHHNIYRPENGQEQEGDLICLCDSCHTLFHSYHYLRGGKFYKKFSAFKGLVLPINKQAANDPQYELEV